MHISECDCVCLAIGLLHALVGVQDWYLIRIARCQAAVGIACLRDVAGFFMYCSVLYVCMTGWEKTWFIFSPT